MNVLLLRQIIKVGTINTYNIISLNLVIFMSKCKWFTLVSSIIKKEHQTLSNGCPRNILVNLELEKDVKY